MLKTPELAMQRARKVTTVYNGKCEIWTDYEEAKAYFLEMMIQLTAKNTTEQSAFIFSLCMGLTSVLTKIERSKLC